VVTIVVDNSALLPLFLPDECSVYAEKLLLSTKQGNKLACPGLLLAEFSNAVLTALRRGRLTDAQAESAHREFLGVPLSIEECLEGWRLRSLHHLALEQGLSIYDAIYLKLAIEAKGDLATLDGKLRQAAQNVGIQVFE